MNRFWNLRDEYYRLLHRWPAAVAAFAVGCLLGLLAAYLWPAYFRASRQVYVGLNAYRTYSDTNFLALAKPRYSNIDNYHYWQMNQLDTVLLMDALLQETLDELRRSDAYWENVDVAGFRDLLDTEWRTAGEWTLIVSHPDQARAQQALEVWSDLAVQRVQRAVGAARQVIFIDQEIEQAAKNLFVARQRQQALSAARMNLEGWLERAAGLPEDQPLPPLERWQVYSFATSLALGNPPWRAILESQPAAEAPPDAYRRWVETVLQQLDLELAALPPQIAALEQERAALEGEYTAESGLSLSLSPNLEIERFGPVSARLVRPTTTMILIGGFVGFLAYLLLELVGISRRAQARE
jgi:hypothetical protein